MSDLNDQTIIEQINQTLAENNPQFEEGTQINHKELNLELQIENNQLREKIVELNILLEQSSNPSQLTGCKDCENNNEKYKNIQQDLNSKQENIQLLLQQIEELKNNYNSQISLKESEFTNKLEEYVYKLNQQEIEEHQNQEKLKEEIIQQQATYYANMEEKNQQLKSIQEQLDQQIQLNKSNELEKELVLLKQEFQDLQKKNNEINESLNIEKNINLELTKTVDNLNQKINLFQQDNEQQLQKQNSLNQTINDLQKQILSLDKEILEKNQAISSLDIQIEEGNTKFTQLNEQFNQIQKEWSSTIQQNSELKQQIELQKNQIQQLQNQFESQKEKEAQIQSINNHVCQDNENLKKQLNQLENELNSETRDKNQAITQLDNQLQEANTNFAYLNEEFNRIKQECNSSIQQNDQMKQNIIKLEHQIQDYQQQILSYSELEQKLTQKQSNNEEYEKIFQKNEALLNENKLKDSQIIELTHLLNQQKHINSTLETENNSNIQNLQVQLSQIQQNLTQQIFENKQLTLDIQQLKDQLSNKEQIIIQKEESLNQQSLKYNNEIEKLSQSENKLQNEIKILKQSTVEKPDSKGNSQTPADKGKQTLTITKEELLKWDQKARDLTSQNKSLQIEIQQLKNQIEEKNQKINNIQQKLDLSHEGQEERAKALQIIIDNQTKQISEIQNNLQKSLEQTWLLQDDNESKDIELKKLRELLKDHFDIQSQLSKLKDDREELQKLQYNYEETQAKLTEKSHKLSELSDKYEALLKKYEYVKSEEEALQNQNQMMQQSKVDLEKFLQMKMKECDQDATRIKQLQMQIEDLNNEIKIEQGKHERENNSLRQEVNQIRKSESKVKEQLILVENDLRILREKQFRAPIVNQPNTSDSKREKIILESMYERVSNAENQCIGLTDKLKKSENAYQQLQEQAQDLKQLLSKLISEKLQYHPNPQDFNQKEFEKELASMKQLNFQQMQEALLKAFGENMNLKEQITILGSELNNLLRKNSQSI